MLFKLSKIPTIINLNETMKDVIVSHQEDPIKYKEIIYYKLLIT